MTPDDRLHILVAALGSHGDIHPFLGIAKTLRERGHRVTLLAPAMFDSLVRSLQFDFVPIGTIEQFDRFAGNPDLWHPTKAFAVVATGVAELTEPYYRAIVERHIPGRTVLVISSLVLGGRIAQETHAIPTVSVHLSPPILRSLVSPAYLPPMPVSARSPIWLNRFAFWLSDVLVIDRLLAPPLNRFRAALGLPPVRRIFRDWVHSPDRVIGLFPDWFAPPAPDWPPQTVVTGFPLYDEADVTPLDPQLAQFLDAGTAPIAFTPGSAMRHGRFFAAAVAACRKLGRRALLLSRHAEHIPRDLPTDIRHVPYAPFSRLLPRCAAIVHHGGIGTSAQGLAAGIPQVIVPMAHDQPDNARHLQRLGVAATVPANKFSATRAAAVLDQLLTSPQVAAACAEFQKRTNAPKSLAQTADWIERAQR